MPLEQTAQTGNSFSSLDASHQATLQPLTSALLECLTPAEVVAVILDRGIAVMRSRAALVVLITEDGQSLKIVRAEGFADKLMSEWETFPLSMASPLGQAVLGAQSAAGTHCRTISAEARQGTATASQATEENAVSEGEGHAVYCEGPDDWNTRYPELVRAAEWAHFQASASLPLVARSRVIGGLYFSFSGPRTFTKADKQFLSVLSHQCALALDRCLLLEEASIARKEAEHARDAAERSRLQEEALRRSAEATERRHRFLAEAGELLGSSLNFQETLERITRLAVPEMCDWCAVDILEGGSHIQRLAVAHVDPDKVIWAHELQRKFPSKIDSPTGLGRVLREGTGEFIPMVTQEMIDAVKPREELRNIINTIGFVSYICTPLVARGNVLGAVTLVTTTESGRTLTADDFDMAKELARRAAIAVENARLYSNAVVANSQARQEIAEREQAERERQIALREREIAMMENARLLKAAAETADRQRRFLKEVLSSVSEGRLAFCETPGDLPALPESATGPFELTRQSLREFRSHLRSIAHDCALSFERMEDLITGTSEAAMNAVTHAGYGQGWIAGDPESKSVQVRIEDHGQGIDFDRLPRATLQRGYSSKGSLGHGFWLMLQTCDRVFLLTGASGTTVVLKQSDSSEPIWMGSRYPESEIVE
jgi:GAF domain-containing protein/anti-sigma regulatory factor (Ser/Thr protein kinase)